MANKYKWCKIIGRRKNEEVYEFKVELLSDSGPNKELWVPGFALPHALIYKNLCALEDTPDVEENLVVKVLRDAVTNASLPELQVIWELSDKYDSTQSKPKMSKAEVDKKLANLSSQSSKEQMREQLLHIIHEKENSFPTTFLPIGNEERCEIEAHINLRSKDTKMITLSRYIRKDHVDALRLLQLHYTDTLIIPPHLEAKVSELMEMHEASVCECTGDQCLPGECNHRIVYDNNGCITIESGVIEECNSRCTCHSSCPNRVTQRGSPVQKEVFSTANMLIGLGVRTNEFVQKGTFMGVYTGQLISHEKNSVDCHNPYTFGIGKKFAIDALKFGNITKLFNHSCCPNVQSYFVRIECSHPSLYEVAFFAIHDIQKGEELCIDYGKGYFEARKDKMTCLCLNHKEKLKNTNK